MKISKVELTNFRNHEKRVINFSDRVVIIGENGSGKSNILEAIYLIATTKSYRADSDVEMIRYKEKVGRIKMGIIRQDGKVDLEVVIQDGSMVGVKKKFLVNGVAKRSTDFGGNFRAVLFSPTDMELLSGSPSGRRRYLDFVISQTDIEYRRSLVSYEKGVRQRNRLLERIREGEAERGQLFFWDRLLIKNGNYLTDKRREFLEFLSEQKIEGSLNFRCVYDKSEISEVRLKQYETEEVLAAVTLVGPHRDDFWVEMEDADQENNFVNVAKYGSRGEQRMAVLWLKKGEYSYLTFLAEKPVLLLDDIFSELDHRYRNEITLEIEGMIQRGGQVVMTTADEHSIPVEGKLKNKDKVWNLVNL